MSKTQDTFALEAAELPAANKFNARRIVVDGIEFASVTESKFYLDLKEAGLLMSAQLQVPYVLIPKGRTWDGVAIRETKYVADFLLPSEDPAAPWVIDVKGFPTKDYILKEKMMLSQGHRVIRFSYSKKASRRFIEAYKADKALLNAYPRKKTT